MLSVIEPFTMRVSMIRLSVSADSCDFINNTACEVGFPASVIYWRTFRHFSLKAFSKARPQGIGDSNSCHKSKISSLNKDFFISALVRYLLLNAFWVRIIAGLFKSVYHIFYIL